MIRTFKNRALRRYWEKGQTQRLPSEYVNRIRVILDALDTSETPADMDTTGLGFHALASDRAGQYAVRVSRNWRITFAWDEGDAIDVDLIDYH